VDTQNQDARIRVGSSVVRDERTGDLIVKLVNMLPVSVEVKADLSSVISTEQAATVTVLAGDPADKQAKPVSEQAKVGSEYTRTLPAYSFTVVRVAKQATGKKK
jgi:alpha-L-arabinofuranosidase